MEITRYTSSPNVILVKDVNITAADVYVTIEQYPTKITLSGSSLSLSSGDDGTQVTFYLTQEQTALFSVYNKAKVQVNWLISGYRYATEIEYIRIFDNLIEEVLP